MQIQVVKDSEKLSSGRKLTRATWNYNFRYENLRSFVDVFAMMSVTDYVLPSISTLRFTHQMIKCAGQ